MGLSEHRKEIEVIDEKIIRLIDRRNKIAKNVFEAKKLEGLGISDPEQERLVLGRGVALATELNLDVGAIKDIFNILIRMSLQNSMSSSGKDQG